jgi:outer membrane protein OmpA-like peptidoglycan-associated protein
MAERRQQRSGIVRRSPWGLAVVALLGLSGCLAADRGWVREQLAPVQGRVAEVRDRVAVVEQQFRGLAPKVDRILAEVEQLASRQTDTAVVTAPVEPSPERRYVVDGVFAVGTTALTPAAQQAIDAFVQQLPELRERQVVVVGHTDLMGSDEANYLLGQRRAAAVAHYLLDAHGLDPARVLVTSAGGTRPVADNATAEGRQQNRRVEILVFHDQVRLATEIQQRQPPRKRTVEVPPEIQQRQPPRKRTVEVPPGATPGVWPPEIQQRQPPRKLTEDQREQLVRTLREVPKVPLAVVSLQGDGESYTFAKELDELLNTAGWATQGVSQQTMSGIPPGLTFFTNSGDAATFTRAIRLKDILHAVGIAVHSRAHERMPQGLLTLVVGPQPR